MITTSALRASGVGTRAFITLYWLPLGAGGVRLVRWNGRLYEAIAAHLQHRESLDLYHSACRSDSEPTAMPSRWPRYGARTNLIGAWSPRVLWGCRNWATRACFAMKFGGGATGASRTPLRP